ncbi:maleylpyruvate isomerase family mycothiol-dependent enzyme [Microbacterium sp. STN6]|uniref:maleylpyruvate isomerase family mycothiol-dependent enzyme n=1 Tax=Microbacterium sp. STN6 TaxID=2995588 RepID=UPI0022609E45|nr:maleylpyruvate isomerase family mycothiol-dependent enzyme [Microbacterium sp. STN6]MCX7523305.1 maleylpyruvate isomerase family mycothiol-dependent enzyme [Microbacterium sp. STN6]
MVARTDKVTDPGIAADLLLARRGSAYFSRKLNELHDDEYDGPSLLPGWSRRHVIAHVGYNARALTRLTEWAATGVETPMYASPAQRNEEIEFGATLNVLALRNLSDHAIVHLNVEWRDLPAEAWSNQVRTAQGRVVPVSETAWMRAREVWLHAVDLDNGGRFEHFPPEFVDRLLADITGNWSRRQSAEGVPSLRLQPSDRDAALTVGDQDADPVSLTGTAAQLARWASGRGTTGVVTVGGGPTPAAPRWL